MFLSIIVPVYNVEKYLPICLSSLRKQNFADNVEILLIDDGSEDASGKICDEAALQDSHFRVFHQENRGVAAARNCGLSCAIGKYIAWVDPDDYITDDWWQILEPVLLKNPDMVYFDKKILKNDKFTEMHFDKQSRIIERDELIQELSDNIRLISFIWATVLPRKFYLAGKTFYEKTSLGEDTEALHKITFNVKRCIYLHDCLYVYRIRQDSIVHNKSRLLQNAWTAVKINRERRNFYRNQGVLVNEFGVSYKEYLFCYMCQMVGRKLSQNEKINYNDAMLHLKHNKKILFDSKKIGGGYKVKNIFITV